MSRIRIVQLVTLAVYLLAGAYLLQVLPWRVASSALLIECFVALIHWTSLVSKSGDQMRWWGALVSLGAGCGIGSLGGIWWAYVLTLAGGLVAAWAHTLLTNNEHRTQAIAVGSTATLTGAVAFAWASTVGSTRVVVAIIGAGALSAAAELIGYRPRSKASGKVLDEAQRTALASKEHAAMLRAVQRLVRCADVGSREWKQASREWVKLYPRFAEHASFRDAKPLAPKRAENGDLILPIRTGPMSSGLPSSPEKLIGPASAALHAPDGVIGVDREAADNSIIYIRWRIPGASGERVGGWK